MKGFFVLTLVVAYANAATPTYKSDKSAKIVNQKFDIEPDGRAFSYLWDTENNIKVDVTGKVNNINSKTPDLEQNGNVAYISPEGVPIKWKFRAGVNGYEPEGDILPTPPPIPDAIQRLLAYLKGKKPSSESSPVKVTFKSG